ncbi:MAG: phage major capsid protein [Gemmataceae bacterium]
MFVTLKQAYKGQAAGTRIDVADDDAALLIRAGVAEAVAGDPLGGIVAEAVARASAGMAGALGTALDTAVKQFSAATGKSRRHSSREIFGTGEESDPKKTFGAFLLAVRTGDRKALDEMDAVPAEPETKDLGTVTGTAGGFLVPTQFAADLLRVAAERAVVRPRAYVQPMTSRVCEIPALDAAVTPGTGETAAFGGLAMTWTEEDQSRTENDPQFRQLRLEAHELGGYLEASNNLLADSAIPLESLLRNLFGQAIAWHEDYAFLRGDGAGKPLGMINAPACISVARSAASAFALADAANMLSRLMPGWSAESCVWAIHPYHMARLVTMASTALGGGLAWLPQGVSGRPRMALFGIDIMPSEKLPAVNTAGDVLLADCRHYVVGDRGTVEIAYSEHVAFRTNQAAWRVVRRVDGQPWQRAPMTLSDGASTVSPFVTLAAG